MRLMSFALTLDQVRAQTKIVTRRVGWTFLEPGDLIQPVNKVMGFKKGERPTHIGGPIRVLNVRRERLDAITEADVYREGFPSLTPAQFVEMFTRSHRGSAPWLRVTRIEFEYTEAPR